MDTILLIFAGLFGITIGSFLNVVIYRLPRKIMFINDRSECPSCKTQLKWYHNIPLLSYLALRGKCSFCREKISWRYPLVEALNGLFFLFFFVKFGVSYEFVVFSLMTSVLLVIFFIDLDFQIIPDLITLPGIIIGLIASVVPGGIGITSALIGLIVGGGSLYLIAVLGSWLFKKDAMGGGDIKMAAMLGAFLGWQKVIFIFIASSFIGVLVSLVLMIGSSKLRNQRVVPFGPFLALATMVAIVYGDTIIDFYLNTFVYVN